MANESCVRFSISEMVRELRPTLTAELSARYYRRIFQSVPYTWYVAKLGFPGVLDTKSCDDRKAFPAVSYESAVRGTAIWGYREEIETDFLVKATHTGIHLARKVSNRAS